MHVAWKQCSENPPLAYRAFVANCNRTRPEPPCGVACSACGDPCGSRDSVRRVGSPHHGRSVLPDTARMAGTRP
ncbi:hypothetical protein CFB84_04610 [Burkholderia aenigmatica]|uniref:Uncharacterized protein n=1 Tax=Burkholderia aenigmatica TaxID=2015348 RepID=A0A228J0Z4_9BURK|nr:hypothetical protein CFB84_04610 [Burkholderia aenigmatica]